MIRCVLSMATLALPCLVSGQGETNALFARWTASAPLAAEPPPADAAVVLPGDSRCRAPGMPAMLDTGYPIEFVDGGDRIVMRFEEWALDRTVYVDPRNRPAVQDPSPMGVSFGRWSGDTLEIFTLYIDYPYFDRLGTPQSEDVTVFERYTPNAVLDRLDWEITVTDPATRTAPVRTAGYFVLAAAQGLEPFECVPAPTE
jgi:hypothetical protein